MPLPEGSERPQSLGEALALLGLQEQAFREFISQFKTAPQEGWEEFIVDMIVNDFDGLYASRNNPTQIGLALYGISTVPESDRPDVRLFPERLATIRANLREAGISNATIVRLEQSLGLAMGANELRPTKYLLGHFLNLQPDAVRQRVANDGHENGVFAELMTETHRRIRETINQRN